ncbi:MAG: hypothetical protein WC860_01590 [Candidatus Margulisiibacteriota bacterium]|jgi:hypothetical protein
MSFRVDGLPSFGNWFVAKSNVDQVLTPETKRIIQDAMGFKGVKVLNVEQGVKGVNINNILNEIKPESAKVIYQDIANILGVNSKEISTILVLIGGLELSKEYETKLKKSLQKIDTKKANKLANDLGLVGQADSVLIFVDNGISMEQGGFILIEAGLKEIKKTIYQDEQELIEKE